VAEVIKENKKTAPFILALGSQHDLDFNNFYVIIKKISIPCGPMFLLALDTCFKSFVVLYTPFPPESYDHWFFIQHGVGGRPYEKSQMPPVVQGLVGQIMTRYENLYG
jgi:hypothetical protein